MLNKKKAVLGLIATVGMSPVLGTDAFANETTVNDDVNVNGVEETQSVEHAIVTENLNLRMGTGTDKQIILTMPKNSKIEVLNKENGWAKVKYNNVEGFASLKYLTIDNELSPKTENQKQMEVTANSLNVRSGAGTKYKILGSLKKGTKVTVLSISNNWAKINYNNKTAYVGVTYLKDVLVNSSTANNSASNTVKKQMIVTANSLYVRAGTGTNYPILGTLSKNTKVDVIQQFANGWVKISYKGGVGCTSSKYLKDVATPQAPQQTPQAPQQTPQTPQAPSQKVEFRGKKGFDYLLTTGHFIVPNSPNLKNIASNPFAKLGYYNGYDLDGKYTGLDVSAGIQSENQTLNMEICRAILGDEAEAKRLLNDIGEWDNREKAKNFTKVYAGITVEVKYSWDAIVIQSYIK